MTSLDSASTGGYPRAVTDDERPARESEGGPAAVAAVEGASQGVCPCCGLEMPAEALAALVSQPLPVVTPAQPGPAPEVVADGR